MSRYVIMSERERYRNLDELDARTPPFLKRCENEFPPTQRQRERLRDLGYKGPLECCAHASTILDRLLRPLRRAS